MATSEEYLRQIYFLSLSLSENSFSGKIEVQWQARSNWVLLQVWDHGMKVFKESHHCHILQQTVSAEKTRLRVLIRKKLSRV